ncbi:hypothetical protein C3941_19535 [Kaistia algarum]|uniref:hypothetical protein n=1 Tax=Kaistia algarum TaxID=2083279 RepID=UPI000CE7A037|nr:hypothetical protein [Kaistia algarum]MCX5516185.1 hypothetical protein [Kaistia algarum]PPE78259.1 hypothetical protein C3941_19535 [Kaistia algarum]
MRQAPVYPLPAAMWPAMKPIGYARTADGAMRILRHHRDADPAAIPVAARLVEIGGLARGFFPLTIDAGRLVP